MRSVRLVGAASLLDMASGLRFVRLDKEGLPLVYEVDDAVAERLLEMLAEPSARPMFLETHGKPSAQEEQVTQLVEDPDHAQPDVRVTMADRVARKVRRPEPAGTTAIPGAVEV